MNLTNLDSDPPSNVDKSQPCAFVNGVLTCATLPDGSTNPPPAVVTTSIPTILTPKIDPNTTTTFAPTTPFLRLSDFNIFSVRVLVLSTTFLKLNNELYSELISRKNIFEISHLFTLFGIMYRQFQLKTASTLSPTFVPMVQWLDEAVYITTGIIITYAGVKHWER